MNPRALHGGETSCAAPTDYEDHDRRRTQTKKCTKSMGTTLDFEDISEESMRLRWRINQLEKEKLDLMSKHNQQLRGLQLEVARLRSSLEQGEAQRTGLEFQLTVAKRDAERATKLSEDKRKLQEELQQKIHELQKVVEITRQARDDHQHVLQQELGERDALIQSCTSKNQQLHQLLLEQHDALEEAERRMTEVQKEREKEAEITRQQANDLKYLSELEERSRSEKEASIQKVKTLESNLEAAHASHLELKLNFEVMQMRVRDLEAALAVECSNQKEAQCNLELLRAQFMELERVYKSEKERADVAENALELLQKRCEQCMSDLNAALEREKKITADVTHSLETERKQHRNSQQLLKEAVNKQSECEEWFMNCMRKIRKSLEQHNIAGKVGSKEEKHAGSWSYSSEILKMLNLTLCAFKSRQEVTEKQVRDLLFASEKLDEENKRLHQLTADQKVLIEECQQEISAQRHEGSRWLGLYQSLQVELEKERKQREEEKQQWETKRKTEQEEREKDLERREKESQETLTHVQEMKDHHQRESEERLSFLNRLYQRLLAGCPVLRQPQVIGSTFTWNELCNAINEHVELLTSDLLKANTKIACLQSACRRKSVCVKELQNRQQILSSHLAESQRRRDEAWSSKHTLAVTELQKELEHYRSQCDSLNNHIASQTSDLTQAQDLLSKSRRESDSFLLACALFTGTLTHTLLRLQTLCKQKSYLMCRLEERERLAQEVRKLASALEEEEEEEDRPKRAARLRQWRRVVLVVLAVKRWCGVTQMTPVVFRLKRGIHPSLHVFVGSEFDCATQKRGDVGVHWLRSKRLASSIPSSVADLQRALAQSDSSSEDIMSAAHSGLSRLLDHLFCQSESDVEYKNSLNDVLSLQRSIKPPCQTLVSSLQQHFLLFSQRLHSAEVERRSLRLEVANLKKADKREVAAQQFHSVSEELHQALGREQEAQALIKVQSEQLQSLRHQVSAQSAQQHNDQNMLKATTKSLSKVQQQVSKKERSLRILAKHLSAVHKERRKLEERLRHTEDELKEAAKCKACLISYMKAAEESYKEVKDSFDRHCHSQSVKPHPATSLRAPLEPADSVRGAPEIIACQSLLASVTQLYQTFSCRIDWLQEELSTHQSHVTALRSNLRETCILPQPVLKKRHFHEGKLLDDRSEAS
ncbi:coiled-coil domain-containing protein 171 [Neosynchiropus ocellatus]